MNGGGTKEYGAPVGTKSLSEVDSDSSSSTESGGINSLVSSSSVKGCMIWGGQKTCLSIINSHLELSTQSTYQIGLDSYKD